jgi:hypothetical protein
MSGNWNEYNLNPLTRIHWRASLVSVYAVSQMSTSQATIACDFGRKWESSTHCTIVNCGKLLVNSQLPRCTGNCAGSRRGNALRMVTTLGRLAGGEHPSSLLQQ